MESMRNAHEDMGRFFSEFDGDGSKSLDKTEMTTLLHRGTGRQWKESRVGQLMQSIDGDGQSTTTNRSRNISESTPLDWVLPSVCPCCCLRHPSGLTEANFPTGDGAVGELEFLHTTVQWTPSI